jgi:hypothetical protein
LFEEMLEAELLIIESGGARDWTASKVDTSGKT